MCGFFFCLNYQLHALCVGVAFLVLHVFDILCVCVSVAQSCLTLHNPIDCSPPGFSVHGIFQARMLEWVAIPFFQGSSQQRDQIQVSCTADRFFTILNHQGSPRLSYS